MIAHMNEQAPNRACEPEKGESSSPQHCPVFDYMEEDLYFDYLHYLRLELEMMRLLERNATLRTLVANRPLIADPKPCRIQVSAR